VDPDLQSIKGVEPSGFDENITEAEKSSGRAVTGEIQFKCLK
jgi:hypothetical protein